MLQLIVTIVTAGVFFGSTLIAVAPSSGEEIVTRGVRLEGMPEIHHAATRRPPPQYRTPFVIPMTPVDWSKTARAPAKLPRFSPVRTARKVRLPSFNPRWDLLAVQHRLDAPPWTDLLQLTGLPPQIPTKMVAAPSTRSLVVSAQGPNLEGVGETN